MRGKRRRVGPAFHIYIGDLLKDNNFAVLPGQAQNLWIRILLHMHENKPRGRLTVGERPMTEEEIAKLCNMPMLECGTLLCLIEKNNVSQRVQGALANRRMMREVEHGEFLKERARHAAQVRWGNRAKPMPSMDATGMRSMMPRETRNKKQEAKREEQKDASLAAVFETEIWGPYPSREGKKIGKAEAFAKYQELSEADRTALAQAVQHYREDKEAKKGIGVKDLHRWIKSGKGIEPWREWIELKGGTSDEGGAKKPAPGSNESWDEWERKCREKGHDPTNGFWINPDAEPDPDGSTAHGGSTESV